MASPREQLQNLEQPSVTEIELDAIESHTFGNLTEKPVDQLQPQAQRFSDGAVMSGEERLVIKLGSNQEDSAAHVIDMRSCPQVGQHPLEDGTDVIERRVGIGSDGVPRNMMGDFALVISDSSQGQGYTSVEALLPGRPITIGGAEVLLDGEGVCTVTNHEPLEATTAMEPIPEQAVEQEPASMEQQPEVKDTTMAELASYIEREIDKAVDEQKATMLRNFAKKADGESGMAVAERVNIWEELVRKRQSHDQAAIRDELLYQAEKSQPDSVYSRIAGKIKADARGYEKVDFAVGGEVEELLDDGSLRDPAALDEATKAINLLVHAGLEKFYKWGNPSQLNVTLDLMEKYTQSVPRFDLEQAGYNDLQSAMILSRSALELDLESKPNLTYAAPELVVRRNDTRRALAGLSRMVALQAPVT